MTAKQKIEQATAPIFVKIIEMANTSDNHIVNRCGEVVEAASEVCRHYAKKMDRAAKDGDVEAMNSIIKEMMG